MDNCLYEIPKWCSFVELAEEQQGSPKVEILPNPGCSGQVELWAFFMLFRGFKLFPAPSESRPTLLPLTRPVGQMHDQLSKSNES